MYGYRTIDGECVDCQTFEEAMEIALTYSEVSGLKYKVEGEHIQHFHGRNISNQHQYCWKVSALGEQIGNQRIKGNTRSNGRAVSAS